MDCTPGSSSSLQNQHNALGKVTPMKSTHCPPPPPFSATLVEKPRTQKVVKKSHNRDAGQKPKSSPFRGVTKHKHTGRYEVNLWDGFSWSLSQNRRGKPGSFDNEEEAAYAYDLAALKYFGPYCVLNFPLHTYMKEYVEMKNVSKSEYIARLRRKSSGFSRGDCKYRTGVTKHYEKGQCEERIDNVCDRKHLQLGSFNNEDEAATSYDMATQCYHGPNAVTNFDINKYRTPHILFQQTGPPPPPQLYEPSVTGTILPNSENFICSEGLIDSSISDAMPTNTMMGTACDGKMKCAMDHNGISDMYMGTNVSDNGLMLQNESTNLEMGNHLNAVRNQGSSSSMFDQLRDEECFNMDGVFEAALFNQFGDEFSKYGFYGIEDQIRASFLGNANEGDQVPRAADLAIFSGNKGFLSFPSH